MVILFVGRLVGTNEGEEVRYRLVGNFVGENEGDSVRTVSVGSPVRVKEGESVSDVPQTWTKSSTEAKRLRSSFVVISLARIKITLYTQS